MNSIRFEELYAESSRNGIYKTKEFHGSGNKIINMGELFAYDFISNQKMKRLIENSEKTETMAEELKFKNQIDARLVTAHSRITCQGLRAEKVQNKCQTGRFYQPISK